MSDVLDALGLWARKRPAATALTDGATAITWAELDQEVSRAAELLDGFAGPSDAPVAVVLDNRPAWVVLDLVLIRLGRPSLPLPLFFTPEQRRHALADAGALLLASPPATPQRPTATVAGGSLSIQRLDLPPRPLHPGTAKITYTSGSTGAPKGVCLSQAQMEAVAASLVSAIGAEYAGLHLAALPLAVLLENVAGLYTTMLAGGAYHVHPMADFCGPEGVKPDPARLAAVAGATGATSLILAPEMLRGLTGFLAASGRRLPSLRFVAVGGAKVPPRVLAAAWEVGLPAYEGYGLSECASVVALNTPAAARPGAVGRPLAHLSVRVEAGEIVVGPRPFLGYVGGPPHAGEVRTGDVGELDDDGWLRITGRKSNLLVTALGRNVAPEWVESELAAEPEIAQAVIFGEGAAELCALVVPARDAIDPAQIDQAVQRANARLPPYARVGRWKDVKPFDPGRGETTPNGRPRRQALHAVHRDFIDQPA